MVLIEDAGAVPRTLAAFEALYPGNFSGNLQLDPLFLDPGAPEDPDFHLHPASPLRDRGEFLTHTTAAGSGSVVPVADVSYFSDGFGLVSPDRVQLEGSTEVAALVAVDPAAGLLVLDQSWSWRAGQGVSLAHEGAAPDVGAHELREPGDPGEPAVGLSK